MWISLLAKTKAKYTPMMKEKCPIVVLLYICLEGAYVQTRQVTLNNRVKMGVLLLKLWPL